MRITRLWIIGFAPICFSVQYAIDSLAVINIMAVLEVVVDPGAAEAEPHHTKPLDVDQFRVQNLDNIIITCGYVKYYII